MGLDAQVIAVGPFSESVISALEYSPEYYAGVKAGEVVITNVFVAPRSSVGHELAKAFGVGAFDFGKHHLHAELADLEKLESMFDRENVDQFVLLRSHGFSFYYLPNA